MWQRLGPEDNFSEFHRAIERNRAFERACDWKDNDGKRNLFATDPRDRRKLRDFHGAKKVEAKVAILGVEYTCCKRRAWMNAHERIQEALRRLERISFVGGPYRTRRFLVRSLVLAMFLWAAPWVSITRAATAQLDLAIERAILGYVVPGRNRMLVAAAVGPGCLVSFEACAAVVRQMSRRRASGRARLASSSAGRRSRADRWISARTRAPSGSERTAGDARWMWRSADGSLAAPAQTRRSAKP